MESGDDEDAAGCCFSSNTKKQEKLPPTQGPSDNQTPACEPAKGASSSVSTPKSRFRLYF